MAKAAKKKVVTGVFKVILWSRAPTDTFGFKDESTVLAPNAELAIAKARDLCLARGRVVQRVTSVDHLSDIDG